MKVIPWTVGKKGESEKREISIKWSSWSSKTKSKKPDMLENQSALPDS